VSLVSLTVYQAIASEQTLEKLREQLWRQVVCSTCDLSLELLQVHPNFLK
jgi:hypothetical protein